MAGQRPFQKRQAAPRQTDRAIRRRDDAVLRLDSALQRVRLLEWVHNVGGSQISTGKIIIAFIRKLTADV